MTDKFEAKPFTGLQKYKELRQLAQTAHDRQFPVYQDKREQKQAERAVDRFHSAAYPNFIIQLLDELDLLYKMLSERCVDVVNLKRELAASEQARQAAEQRANKAESRVEHLTTVVIDASLELQRQWGYVDGLEAQCDKLAELNECILNVAEQLEAQNAALREALIEGRHWVALQRREHSLSVIDAALKGDAGTALLTRLQRYEALAQLVMVVTADRDFIIGKKSLRKLAKEALKEKKC